jgi:hypothetical protein
MEIGVLDCRSESPRFGCPAECAFAKKYQLSGIEIAPAKIKKNPSTGNFLSWTNLKSTV